MLVTVDSWPSLCFSMENSPEVRCPAWESVTEVGLNEDLEVTWMQAAIPANFPIWLLTFPLVQSLRPTAILSIEDRPSTDQLLVGTWSFLILFHSAFVLAALRAEQFVWFELRFLPLNRSAAFPNWLSLLWSKGYSCSMYHPVRVAPRILWRNNSTGNIHWNVCHSIWITFDFQLEWSKLLVRRISFLIVDFSFFF